MALEGALSTKGPVTAEEVGTLASHRPVLAAGPLCVIQPVLDLPPVFGGGAAVISSDLFPPVGRNVIDSMSLISIGQVRRLCELLRC